VSRVEGQQPKQENISILEQKLEKMMQILTENQMRLFKSLKEDLRVEIALNKSYSERNHDKNEKISE